MTRRLAAATAASVGLLTVGLTLTIYDIREFGWGLYLVLISVVSFIIISAFCLVGTEQQTEPTLAKQMWSNARETVIRKMTVDHTQRLTEHDIRVLTSSRATTLLIPNQTRRHARTLAAQHGGTGDGELMVDGETGAANPLTPSTDGDRETSSSSPPTTPPPSQPGGLPTTTLHTPAVILADGCALDDSPQPPPASWHDSPGCLPTTTQTTLRTPAVILADGCALDDSAQPPPASRELQQCQATSNLNRQHRDSGIDESAVPMNGADNADVDDNCDESEVYYV